MKKNHDCLHWFNILYIRGLARYGPHIVAAKSIYFDTFNKKQTNCLCNISQKWYKPFLMVILIFHSKKMPLC